MTAQAISAIGQSTPSLYTAKKPDAMDKMDFLNLLITQLQQQDPLNPQDPTEFTSQLTQFSSLEQMMAMNKSIQDLQTLQLSTNNTLATSLVGKDVTYNGEKTKVTAGVATSIAFSSSTAAKNATVTITNSAGKIVRTIQVPSVSSGDNTLAWDGKGNDGAVLPDGSYTVGIAAKDSTGNDISIQTMQTGHVNAVVFRNGQTFIQVDGQEIAAGDIIGIHEPAASTAA